ncbi:hypothetical protein GCM10028832_46180 [Streptomyces sparsus]
MGFTGRAREGTYSSPSSKGFSTSALEWLAEACASWPGSAIGVKICSLVWSMGNPPNQRVCDVRSDFAHPL